MTQNSQNLSPVYDAQNNKDFKIVKILCKFTSSNNTNYQYCFRHTIKIKTNDNELKKKFHSNVNEAINHEVILRRTNSFGCCISHSLKNLAYKSTIEPKRK